MVDVFSGEQLVERRESREDVLGVGSEVKVIFDVFLFCRYWILERFVELYLFFYNIFQVCCGFKICYCYIGKSLVMKKYRKIKGLDELVFVFEVFLIQWEKNKIYIYGIGEK